MHMLSKKDLSSHEMGTLRRSRIPTTVVTANGELPTNEQAQVYVHDLDLFVTVNILDDTPAVLSLGKLCDEHGFSNERVSGKQPRLTKQEKNILCKTENFVPMVVPGLSSSSSTPPSQDSASTSTSISSSPASERSDELAPGNVSHNPARDSENSNDRLRDLRQWLEEFTRNLEDTEMPAPAHISQDSDSELPTKLASKKPSFFYSLPERPKL